jgi:hypothetical protein
MNEDSAGETHRKLYGKSDKANAVGNRDNEFQAGYAHGMETYGYHAEHDHQARACPSQGSWRRPGLDLRGMETRLLGEPLPALAGANLYDS